MTLPTATSAERAALVRMVHVSAQLIVEIGRAIADHGVQNGAYLKASEDFVDAVIEVSENGK